MTIHIKLIQLQMYLPNVSASSDLSRALGLLKRFCNEQQNIALSIEPYSENDRGEMSFVVIGSNKINVEQDCERLLTWIESKIIGQTLASETSWL
jgi:hypothetical protein